MLRALALLLLALPSFACCPFPQANSSCDHKMSEVVPDPTSPPSLQKVQKQKWAISSDVFKRARKLPEALQQTFLSHLIGQYYHLLVPKAITAK